MPRSVSRHINSRIKRCVFLVASPKQVKHVAITVITLNVTHVLCQAENVSTIPFFSLADQMYIIVNRPAVAIFFLQSSAWLHAPQLATIGFSRFFFHAHRPFSPDSAKNPTVSLSFETVDWSSQHSGPEECQRNRWTFSSALSQFSLFRLFSDATSSASSKGTVIQPWLSENSVWKCVKKRVVPTKVLFPPSTCVGSISIDKMKTNSANSFKRLTKTAWEGAQIRKQPNLVEEQKI